MKSWQQTILLGAGFGVAFLLGQTVPNLLSAQGRGPVNAPPSTAPDPGAPGAAPEPIVVPDDGGHSASANGFVAVTGSYGLGTSVLYLVDTVNRQLAVYEARGGSMEQRRIVLVGARRLDLDLQLRGYNDRSEYDYDALEKQFQKRGRKDADVQTGLEPNAPVRK